MAPTFPFQLSTTTLHWYKLIQDVHHNLTAPRGPTLELERIVRYPKDPLASISIVVEGPLYHLNSPSDHIGETKVNTTSQKIHSFDFAANRLLVAYKV
jgi:hypothetical protein